MYISGHLTLSPENLCLKTNREVIVRYVIGVANVNLSCCLRHFVFSLWVEEKGGAGEELGEVASLYFPCQIQKRKKRSAPPFFSPHLLPVQWGMDWEEILAPLRVLISKLFL